LNTSNARPTVDVILSTYNGEAYVRSALSSVLAQTYPHLRCHIIDDASKDATWEIVCAFDDPRIVRRRNPTNRGLFPNINQALRDTSAPIVKLLGQDDVLEPDCLERGVAALESAPEVGCLWTYGRYIDEAGEVVAADDLSHQGGPIQRADALLDMVRWGCLSANIANLFFTRDALEAAGPFREDIMSADFEMLTRINRSHRLARLVEPLVRVRKHDAQWSSDLHAMENQVIGNCLAFRNLLDQAASEPALVEPDRVRRLLIARLAEYELDWAVKALVRTGRVGGFWRSLQRISGIASLTQVAPAWAISRARRSLAGAA
jgi:glycosyltransferase involved in cell wall biosynthesis